MDEGQILKNVQNHVFPLVRKEEELSDAGEGDEILDGGPDTHG